MMPDATPNGSVVLVTGGSRGIGRAIVEDLARAGSTVAFTYSNSRPAAEELVAELTGQGCSVSSHQADVRDYKRACDLIAEIEQSIGPIGVLVNNAGIKRDSALHRMEPEAWTEVIETNLGGTFHYCRALIYPMIKRRGGSIINIVSVSGIVGLAGQTNYSASKAGIIGFTRALSREVARFGIRVNAIAPGFIETEMLTDIPEEARKRMFSQIPQGAPGTPRQVAHAVAFLAGDQAQYITGQVLPVDGGMV